MQANGTRQASVKRNERNQRMNGAEAEVNEVEWVSEVGYVAAPIHSTSRFLE